MPTEKPACTLYDWSVTNIPVDASVYMAPEQLTYIYLQGVVDGHPEFPDGSHIQTGYVNASTGRVVECADVIVELGHIAPGYRKWLKKNVPDWDWRNPVKVVSDAD